MESRKKKTEGNASTTDFSRAGENSRDTGLQQFVFWCHHFKSSSKESKLKEVAK